MDGRPRTSVQTFDLLSVVEGGNFDAAPPGRSVVLGGRGAEQYTSLGLGQG